MVKTAGVRWRSVVIDQRDLPALRGAAAEIEREFGAIDILFANAGIQQFKPLLELEDTDWHTTIDVNLTGTANAIRAFAPGMVKRRSGRIIVTTSTQGRLFRIEMGHHRTHEVGRARTRPIRHYRQRPGTGSDRHTSDPA